MGKQTPSIELRRYTKRIEIVGEPANGTSNTSYNDKSIKSGFDRKRTFVIDRNEDDGPEVFHAVKKRRRGNEIHAIVVRKYGT